MSRAAGSRPDVAKAENAPAAPRPLEVTFPSSSEYLSLLRTTVRWFAKKCRFSDKACHRIVLAAVEATTNIIRHAYAMDPSQRITLRMAEVDGGIQLEFLDDGRHSPQAFPECPRTEDLKPGGLGVRMMKMCMDGFSYESRPQGGSRLVLRKLRDGDEECGCA